MVTEENIFCLMHRSHKSVLVVSKFWSLAAQCQVSSVVVAVHWWLGGNWLPFQEKKEKNQEEIKKNSVRNLQTRLDTSGGRPVVG